MRGKEDVEGAKCVRKGREGGESREEDRGQKNILHITHQLSACTQCYTLLMTANKLVHVHVHVHA